jgi:cytochrome c-type biogenesis protein CcmH/NrfF
VRRLVLLLLLAVAVPLWAPVWADVAPTQFQIEESLTCQCGCGLTVHSCNHLNCGSGEPMKKEIAERLAKGESKETILAAFSSKYGEKVLSSPTFSGFNWFAWITPFAAVLLSAGVLTMVIRRRAASAPVAPAPPPRPADNERLARLRRELDESE